MSFFLLTLLTSDLCERHNLRKDELKGVLPTYKGRCSVNLGHTKKEKGSIGEKTQKHRFWSKLRAQGQVKTPSANDQESKVTVCEWKVLPALRQSAVEKFHWTQAPAALR